MAKRQKKRNKTYRGADAKLAQPSVTRVAAVERNKLQQWWHDKKRIAKPVMIAVAVIVIAIWLLFELFRAIL